MYAGASQRDDYPHDITATGPELRTVQRTARTGSPAARAANQHKYGARRSSCSPSSRLRRRSQRAPIGRSSAPSAGSVAGPPRTSRIVAAAWSSSRSASASSRRGAEQALSGAVREATGPSPCTCVANRQELQRIGSDGRTVVVHAGRTRSAPASSRACCAGEVGRPVIRPSRRSARRGRACRSRRSRTPP